MKKFIAEDVQAHESIATKRRRKRGIAVEPTEEAPAGDVEIPAADAAGVPTGPARMDVGKTAAASGAKRQSMYGPEEMDVEETKEGAADKRPRHTLREQLPVSPGHFGPPIATGGPTSSTDTSGTEVARSAGGTASPTDAEDLVDSTVPMEDESQANVSSLMALEVIEEGRLSEEKAELLDHVRFQVANQFRRHNLDDVSLKEVDNIATLAVEIAAVDIAEVYSPHRFTARASEFQLRPGFAADLEELRPDGEHWDLSRKEDEAILAELQTQQDPYLLTGGPPCELFSQLQAISWAKQDPARREERWALAKHHLRVATDCYWRQIHRGRLFLHEHPWGASSWKEPEITALSSRPDVYIVKGPMCRWGMESTDKRVDPPRTGYVRKETGWMTNSKRLAELLEGVCSNVDGSRPWHRHVHLIGGLGKAARIYPPALVEAVLQVLQEMMHESGELNAVEAFGAGPSPAEEPMPNGEWQEFWDHVNGGYLDAEKVSAARAQEREWIAKQGVYRIVPRSMCLEETGKAPIPLRWIDTNKGDNKNPNYRSRQVVREIKARKKLVDQLSPEETFSSMPPLEAMYTMLSFFMTTGVKPHMVQAVRKKLGIFDIKRAHFYGKARRRVFVELDEEDRKKHGADTCGLLEKSMYGTQDASAIWQDDYCDLLNAAGFKRGKSNGAIFFHPSTGVRVLVHGDDFVVLTDNQGDLDNFEKLIASRYEYKKEANLGWDSSDDKSATVLNRIITLESDDKVRRTTVEPDARHAQIIVSELGLEGGKGCEAPNEKKSAEQQILDWNTPLLEQARKVQYRSLTMRAAYLAQDRCDIAETTKHLARFMSQPHEAAWQGLKKLGRYLKKYPSLVRTFAEQTMSSKLKVVTDSDHAGCASTRRSTTGLAVLLGRHCTRHSSNMQSTTALSSGESEYYALVKAASVGLGMQSMMLDWGVDLPLVVASDSSAARGHVTRRGLGKMRHIQTRYLWLQERVGEGHVKVISIPGKQNPADMMTKALSGAGNRAALERLGFNFATASTRQKEVLT